MRFLSKWFIATEIQTSCPAVYISYHNSELSVQSFAFQAVNVQVLTSLNGDGFGSLLIVSSCFILPFMSLPVYTIFKG